MFEERSFPIANFQGLAQDITPLADARYTRDLDNVRVRRGRVISRLGTPKYRGITTVSATVPIVGLMEYQGSNLANSVLRMTSTKVHKLNTGTDVWDDATGTNLTDSTAALPQWDMHKGVLVFTNEGLDRPRKYTGSGNTAVLAGTPPYCKALCNYMDFLLLFNTSTDGTTFSPRNGIYSNDYDNDWSLCEGNELIFQETAGEVVAARNIGRMVLVGKNDALIHLRWVGGQTRFFQEKLPFDQGVAAPLSFVTCGEAGVIFLATDLQLYLTDGQRVQQLPLRVQRKLQETLDIANVRICSAAAFPDTNTYYFLYPTSSSDTYSRGLIGYNWSTEEFFHDTYSGHQFLRLLAFRLSRTTANLLITSANDLVYQIEGADDDDDGTPVNRYYTTDWQTFGVGGYKELRGIDLTFRRRPQVRVKIEVARDGNTQWLWGKTYSLQGLVGSEDVKLYHKLPEALPGQEFNCKVSFYHDGTAQAGELRSLIFKYAINTRDQAKPARAEKEQAWQ